ncbi:MAG: DUF4349 domain-containing protein [Flavobacteriales bacterium]|nr:DUF4349 domain-containing protein [Flavobacteriales bacterium]
MKLPFAILALMALIVVIPACQRSANPEATSMLEQERAPEEGKATGEAGSLSFWSTNNGLADMSVAAAADSSTRFMSSSAALTNGDTARRFIRTADLKFRVRDVVQATYAIEDIAAAQGGHVEHAHLTTRVDQRYTMPVSEDSLLETTRFTVVSNSVLRVPAGRLDTTLKMLARFVDFLDHRTVKAEDVRPLMLANLLEQRRITRYSDRVEKAVDEQGNRLKETSATEERLLNRQEHADRALLSNMSLQDRIDYSTITLEIYQRQSVRQELLANERGVDRYEPGFFSKLGKAVAGGWRMLLRFFLLVAGNWSVILLAAIAFILLRRWLRMRPQG